MNLRAAALLWLACLGLAAGLLFFLQRDLAGSWLAFGVHPQVQQELEAARQDLRRLAEVDPDNQAAYRERFDRVQSLLAHLRILEHNREAMVRRYQLILAVLFGGVALLSAAVWVVRQRRLETRLGQVRGWLEALSSGHEVDAGSRRRDTVGRIAAMIEEVSRAVVRDRRRLRALRHLSAWQEAARRQAHEVRTPLAAARLELERLRELLPAEGEAARRTGSLEEELRRLERFAHEYATFARLPAPRRQREDLGAVVAEFIETFQGAWQNLHLGFGIARGSDTAAPICRIDREQLRQVLVNLCENTARAFRQEKAGGSVEMTLRTLPEGIVLEVADNGPGVPEDLRDHLFEPYVSSRAVGEGMGLGLAISKKILLDHGGDLELVENSPAGATFRLTLPAETTAETAEEVG